MRRSPGRPARVVPELVRICALELFERKGYEQTTMDEIAISAGISRQTLFRLAPTKADLVWEQLDQQLMTAFASVARETGPLTLQQIVHRVFRTPAHYDDPAAVELLRRRLKLASQSPLLLNHGSIDIIHERMTQAVARAVDLTAPPELVARALVSVGIGAMIWWAENPSEHSAGNVLSLALRSLANASGPPSSAEDTP